MTRTSGAFKWVKDSLESSRGCYADETQKVSLVKNGHTTILQSLDIGKVGVRWTT
jgi:hypothetical protein